MRRLRYILVESGRCQHCRKDAGEHSYEGLCSPQGVPHLRHADVPEPCYRGESSYAFVDLDSPEAKSLFRNVLEVGVP